MSSGRWPDDHPNARILLFIETSRLLLERAGDGPVVQSTGVLLGRIEALIEQMAAASGVSEINLLVAQVGPLVNEAAARMEVVRAQVDGRP